MNKDTAVAEWVRKVNELAAEIERQAAVIHPSAWGEQLSDLHARYVKLAKQGPKDGDK